MQTIYYVSSRIHPFVLHEQTITYKSYSGVGIIAFGLKLLEVMKNCEFCYLNTVVKSPKILSLGLAKWKLVCKKFMDHCQSMFAGNKVVRFQKSNIVIMV